MLTEPFAITLDCDEQVSRRFGVSWRPYRWPTASDHYGGKGASTRVSILGGDAGFGEGGADGAAFGGEVLGFGEFYGGGDGFGAGGGCGEVAVELFGVVVFGDGQGPDEVVEVAFVALTVGLEVGYFR